MINRIGNSVFFTGLIVFTLAAMVGMPLAIPIGALSLVLIFIGGWLWLKPSTDKKISISTPLSQQPATFKIFAGIPALGIIAFAFLNEAEKEIPLTAGLFLAAYAFVGIIESQIDKWTPSAKHRWDNLVWWKKLAISVAAITAALFSVLLSMPILAELIYG